LVLAQNGDQKLLTYVSTYGNPNALSDDDRIDIWLRAQWDQISAALDHQCGKLPPAESTARKLALLGVDVDVDKLRAVDGERRKILAGDETDRAPKCTT
jgi:hypothetical protein